MRSAGWKTVWVVAVVCTLTAGAQTTALSPRTQDLQKAYQEEKQRVDGARRQELGALIARHTADMRTLLAEKKRAGNISGVAQATRSLDLLEALRKELEEKGDVQIPTEVRRELTALRDQLAAAKQAMDERHAAALAELEARYRQRLTDAVQDEGGAPLSADQIAEFFKTVLPQESGHPQAAPPASAPPAADGPADASAATAGEPPRTASPGSATNWVVLARWFASVSSLEVIEVPLLDRREPEQRSEAGSPVGQPFETRYEPVRVLSSAEGMRFRVAGLPRHDAPEVEAWPSRANGWTLLLRLRPGRDVPSRHGIEIQVAGPGAELLRPLVAERAVEAPPDHPGPSVQVRITSQPDGAVVLVDGVPFRQGQDYARTPCVLPVPAGVRHIRLRKFGYLDGVIERFQAAEGATLHWTFQKDPATADVTLSISSRSPLKNTGVTVKRGDRILITASGTWRCGKDREEVDAEGYPNDKTFFKYYLNPRDAPRLLAGANYGALIMRIGQDGPLRKVGKSYRGVADADGPVFLGINEAGEAHLDNAGSLSVRILKSPGE